jgi:hypothetical protein
MLFIIGLMLFVRSLGTLGSHQVFVGQGFDAVGTIFAF